LQTNEKVGEECETEGGDDAVDGIGGGDAQPGDETRESSVCERAANGEDADRSDGRGDRDADDEAANEQPEGTLSLFILYGLHAKSVG
jgi:hypothetical protein